MTLDLLIAFGLGLLIGSFVNVLIYRLPRMIETAHTTEGPIDFHRYNLCWPSSHCPNCQTPLRARDIVPVLSYVWLKGRCHFCHCPIHIRYPIIELVTALIWLACIWQVGFNPQGLSWALFATLLLALSVIDWQTTLLPDDLTQSLLWSGLMASALNWTHLPLQQSLWGAVLGYVFLWSVAAVFERVTGKQGMGAGDFKLLAGLGAWLGAWALLPVILTASFSGAIFGLVLKYSNRLREDGYIPFGPFLAVAGVLVACLGFDDIAHAMNWSFIA